MVEKLLQFYLFIPLKFKELYLVHILTELAGNSFMVFCSTCSATTRLALLLRALGITAIPLHGQMSQNKRLGSLNKFKSKARNVLLATDVASRGLDIPHVDVVINYDIPTHSKDYIHRVGRTARAGRAGKAVTFVSQYDVELYQRIEEVLLLAERVGEAAGLAKVEQRELEDKQKKGGKRRRGAEQDTEEGIGVSDRLGAPNKKFKKPAGKEKGKFGGKKKRKF